jgi:release factor glutamine methyltransferase
MLTVREAYQRTRNALRAIYAPGEAGAVADILFERIFQIGHKDLLLNGEAQFQSEAELLLHTEKLLKHEPLQHIIGYDMFGGLRIRINRHVLIPRPETEELLDWVFETEMQAPAVIADLCTGSGCMALVLRKKYHESDIFGTDLSEEALFMAAQSELDNFDTARVNWVRNDLLLEPLKIPVPDLVVCNPPYIMFSERRLMADNVLEFEPHTALFVNGPDPLLFYKRVIELYGHNGKTIIYFELNPLTAGDLQAWCRNAGLTCEIRKDMSDLERFARITGEIA